MALDDIIKGRLDKRAQLKQNGTDPYPLHTKRTHSIAEALASFDSLAASNEEVSLAGRLMSVREHGALTFGDLYDGSAKMQIAFKEDSMGESAYRSVAEVLDLGDFVSLTGILFTTNRGERTLEVRSFALAGKTLRPLPEKWHGLKDVEERYRRRYLDLLMNEEVRGLFETRETVVRTIRSFLLERGFREVETPILQSIAGGAAARPFVTHLNAFDMDMFLRIAPELYLKRLLVGGYEKVFELGRNFRNEGVDYSHNPEFTMLEFYQAYSDYKEGMKLTEELVTELVKATIGSMKHEFDGVEVDFTGPWERITFNELLQKFAQVNYEDYTFESLRQRAIELDVKIGKDVYSKAEVADAIYKKYCLPKIVNPTFVIHHPAEMLPLAKPLADNPEFVGSFQLIIAGWELVKAYSELNDPVAQREAFEEQEALRKKGDPEAHTMDEDFVEALEYGMPPALGLGMGIDRIATFLSGAHALRETILFPTMRPVADSEGDVRERESKGIIRRLLRKKK